jgi:hypothetical protein
MAPLCTRDEAVAFRHRPVLLLPSDDAKGKYDSTRATAPHPSPCRIHDPTIALAPLVTVVIVRPLWFAVHPGAHLWALVANKLSRRAADRLFEHLLGDESIATIYKSHAATELQERYPTSRAMNQHQTQPDSEVAPDHSDSLWHCLLEAHLERKALEAQLKATETESVALKRAADEARAEVEKQREEVEKQREEAEKQRALVRQLRAELEELKSRG